MKVEKFENLENKARLLRRETFEAFIREGEAHLGGAFSCVEVLVFLYEAYLDENDHFFFSKAHSSFPLIFLLRSRGLHPPLTTHLELDAVNGIECTAGSLGHGFPIATGFAAGLRLSNKSGRVVVLISDGECQEGTTWETCLLANKFNLDNLLVIVDYNKIQALDFVENALPLGDLGLKFDAFGFNVIEVEDGHNFDQLKQSFEIVMGLTGPVVLILHTVKGKGIPEFENDPVWHAKKIKSIEDISTGRRALGFEQ